MVLPSETAEAARRGEPSGRTSSSRSREDNPSPSTNRRQKRPRITSTTRTTTSTAAIATTTSSPIVTIVDPRDQRATEDFIDELIRHYEFWTQYENTTTGERIQLRIGSGDDELYDEVCLETLRKILNARFHLDQLGPETLLEGFREKREWTRTLVARAKQAKAFDTHYMSALYDHAVEDLADVATADEVLRYYDPIEIRKTLVYLFRVIETAYHLMQAHLLLRSPTVPESIFDSVVNHYPTPLETRLLAPGGVSPVAAHDASSKAEQSPKLRDHQELILYILDEIATEGLRRVDGDLYRQIFIGAYASHAWTKEYTIEQFVHKKCQKESHYYYWNKLTQKLGVAQNLHDFLSRTTDAQIPDLRTDRHVLSFNNGYLLCNHIHTYDQHRERAPRLFPQFRRYEDDAGRDGASEIVSAVLHRLDFPTEYLLESPDDLTMHTVLHRIPTPELDDILDFQKLSPEVKMWVYVFIGRMLFDSNVHDNWQIMPFLKGVAGSGKSTIAYDVIARFYNPEDVFMVSNNCERKFGMQNCLRGDGKGLRYMCVMPEVKQDFGMEQADWQQAVSGERIPINRKHMTTITETFNLPMFAAGNQMIGYDDNSNSVARRVPVIKFNHPVGGKQDGEKPKKLHNELAHIILKCVYAYAWAVNEYGRSNIWDCLPAPFREERQILVEAQHPLMNYLSSGKVLLKPYLFCPMKLFVQQFKQHVQDNCLSKFQWNADFYDLAFKEHSVRVEKNQRLLYDNKRIHGTFLKGVDVIDGDSTPVERAYLEQQQQQQQQQPL